MKVIRKSNLGREDYRGDQHFVAQRLSDRQAKIVAERLNEMEHEHSEDFYLAVPDDYVLPPDWQP